MSADQGDVREPVEKLVRAEMVLVAVRADREDVLDHRLGAHEGPRRDGPDERRDVLRSDLHQELPLHPLSARWRISS